MTDNTDLIPDRELATRYRGHMSLCEIDLDGQKRISGARVLIIGAGGLGSPVALYLAAAGIGHIRIMDPDTVSLSNLQRQIIHTSADIDTLKADSARSKMLAVNPHIEVEAVRARLTPGNAAETLEWCDIAVDCTDNTATRLLIDSTCRNLGKPYVYGAVSRFSGQVFTHVPGSAGYTDIFGAAPGGEELPCSVEGIFNAVVGVTGTIQAAEAVKWIARTGDLLVNRILVADLLTMDFNVFAIPAPTR